uniref:Variant surface glycoprotein 1065 n=1 Tax=Trypanosoma brucei TaxID=5691 RepID=M4SXJ1_9TRYP|nr:variant surface glycoprotein 1065 [Trypanosoma brucei]
MTSRQIIIAVAILAVVLPAAVAPTATGRIKQEKWTAACSLDGELENVAQLANHKLDMNSKAANSYLKQYMRTRIYIAVKKQGESSKEDVALLAYYLAQADIALNKLAGAGLAKQTTAIRNAARLQGAIVDFVSAMGQLAAPGTQSCLEAEAGGDAFRAATTPFAGASKGCQLAATDLQATKPSIAGFTADGIAGELSADANVGATTTATADSCHLTQPKNGHRLLGADSSEQNVAGNLKFAGGIFFIGGSGMETKGLGQMAPLKSSDPLLAAAHAAYQQTQETPTDYIFKKPSELKEDAVYTPIFARIVKGLDEVPTDQSELKTTIENSYGGDANMPKSYNTDFAETQVMDPNGKPGTTVALSSLVSLKDLAIVLTHYESVNQRKLKDRISELEKQINKESSKIPEKICNDIGDQNETGCTATPGCHFVSTNSGGKKCTLSKKTKKEAEKKRELVEMIETLQAPQEAILLLLMPLCCLNFLFKDEIYI